MFQSNKTQAYSKSLALHPYSESLALQPYSEPLALPPCRQAWRRLYLRP